MPEMPHAGEEHGDPVLIGGLDDLFVANAAAGLDDGGYARFGGGIDAVTEGEEGIRSQHRSPDRKQRLLDGDL